MEGWERGTSMPLQTGCLSVVCMSHDPHLICASISNPHSTCWPQRSAEKLPPYCPRVGLFESKQRLITTACISCIKLIKVVGEHMGTCALTTLDERAAWRRPLSWLSESPPLLSAEVNKRPNNTRVKAIESYFAKWSLIGPFFLVDQSYDFGGRLNRNSGFKSFPWKWTTWKKWPLP